MMMAVCRKTLQVNGRALRRHHPCGLVTLHLADGCVAITRGVSRRNDWASYQGTRELALKLIRALRVVPKGCPVEVVFIPALMQTRGFLKETNEGYVYTSKEWQARLVIRYDLYELQLYGWEEVNTYSKAERAMMN